MSLEGAIHQRWRAFLPLAELLPAERFYTGVLPAAGPLAPELPYATLRRAGASRITRTSGGMALATVTLRLSIWATELDLAKRIAAEVQERFERSEFDAGEVRVQDMREAGCREIHEVDGTWRIELDYVLRTETKR